MEAKTKINSGKKKSGATTYPDKHRVETMADIKGLKDLIEHLRATLKSEIKRDKKRVDKIFYKPKFTPEGEEIPERPKILMTYLPHTEKYYGALPKLINYSSLLLIYTLFEERGRKLCQELKKGDSTIKISLDEIRRQADYESIKLFLDKICGIKYSYWRDIELLAQLRHRIVHNNGNTKDENLIKKITATKGLQMAVSGHILVGDAYVDFVLGRVTHLFETTFEQKNFGAASVFHIGSYDFLTTIERVEGKTVINFEGWEECERKSKSKKTSDKGSIGQKAIFLGWLPM